MDRNMQKEKYKHDVVINVVEYLKSHNFISVGRKNPSNHLMMISFRRQITRWPSQCYFVTPQSGTRLRYLITEMNAQKFKYINGFLRTDFGLW